MESKKYTDKLAFLIYFTSPDAIKNKVQDQSVSLMRTTFESYNYEVEVLKDIREADLKMALEQIRQKYIIQDMFGHTEMMKILFYYTGKAEQIEDELLVSADQGKIQFNLPKVIIEHLNPKNFANVYLIVDAFCKKGKELQYLGNIPWQFQHYYGELPYLLMRSTKLHLWKSVSPSLEIFRFILAHQHNYFDQSKTTLQKLFEENESNLAISQFQQFVVGITTQIEKRKYSLNTCFIMIQGKEKNQFCNLINYHDLELDEGSRLIDVVYDSKKKPFFIFNCKTEVHIFELEENPSEMYHDELQHKLKLYVQFSCSSIPQKVQYLQKQNQLIYMNSNHQLIKVSNSNQEQLLEFRGKFALKVSMYNNEIEKFSAFAVEKSGFLFASTQEQKFVSFELKHTLSKPLMIDGYVIPKSIQDRIEMVADIMIAGSFLYIAGIAKFQSLLRVYVFQICNSSLQLIRENPTSIYCHFEKPERISFKKTQDEVIDILLDGQRVGYITGQEKAYNSYQPLRKMENMFMINEQVGLASTGDTICMFTQYKYPYKIEIFQSMWENTYFIECLAFKMTTENYGVLSVLGEINNKLVVFTFEIKQEIIDYATS